MLLLLELNQSNKYVMLKTYYRSKRNVLDKPFSYVNMSCIFIREKRDVFVNEAQDDNGRRTNDPFIS